MAVVSIRITADLAPCSMKETKELWETTQMHHGCKLKQDSSAKQQHAELAWFSRTFSCSSGALKCIAEGCLSDPNSASQVPYILAWIRMTKACQSSSPSKLIRCIYAGIPRLPYLGELILSPRQIQGRQLRSSAVLPSICSFWVLRELDDTALHDLKVIRKCILPWKYQK